MVGLRYVGSVPKGQEIAKTGVICRDSLLSCPAGIC